jgi:hypothetical protein
MLRRELSSRAAVGAKHSLRMSVPRQLWTASSRPLSGADVRANRLSPDRRDAAE